MGKGLDMTNEKQTAIEQRENGSRKGRRKTLAALYNQGLQERAKLLTENTKLRMEISRLEKEREMLWKTVDRLEGEKNAGQRYSIHEIIHKNGNKAAIQVMDLKTGKIEIACMEVSDDGKVRDLRRN